MNQCLDLLLRMTAPLEFAASDEGRHLPLIKDLEKTMRNLSARLITEMIQESLPIETVFAGNSPAAILSEFTDAFACFETLPLEEKAARIKKSLLLLGKLKDLLTSVTPCSAPEDKETSTLSSPHDATALHTAFCWEKLSRSILSLKGVGDRTACLLERKGLITIEDMLYFLPRRYEDRRFPVGISQARVGMRETISGLVINSEIKRYGNRPVFEATIEDDSGLLAAKWFRGNSSYLRSIFRKGNRVIITGTIGQFNQLKEVLHPDFEMLDQESDNLLHFQRIVPIYSETEGLYQKNIRKIMKQVVDGYADCVISPIPDEICRKQKLLDIREALVQVHFPSQDQDMDQYNAGKTAAHRRLIFDEFFFFQLGLALQRQGHTLESGISFTVQGAAVKRFIGMLPFSLTKAQKKVMEEIEHDLSAIPPMNRLLQGDVGCGKTVVAMAAMVTACDNGYQAALMAPTEILAEQHYRTIQNWCQALNITAILLTGKKSVAEKKDCYEQIREGKAGIIVGTQAIIQEEVVFHTLGLAVIDEQHRFGVAQRAALRAKGKHPDILVMTATPIPRTLAMTVYGDLDVSVIDEMPPNHKPVKTKVCYERQREKVYELINREIGKKHQVFIVYPLVEGSEHLDMKDASSMAEHLQKDIFPHCRIGLVHGKMKKLEKENTMTAFRAGELDILVATTVIEVGIDIPEASLMIIEHAERFGLSQLHQLRGRVGRSEIASACILMTQGPGSAAAARRLRVMEKTTDGFQIAEEDLALRGPGEFMGVRQSGLPDFRIANLIRDGKILREARDSASELAKRDPQLEDPAHQPLKEELKRRWAGRLSWAQTS